MSRFHYLLIAVGLWPVAVWADSPRPHIVMLIAEREYQTDETLPAFAKAHLGDYRVTVLLEDPEDRNRFVGMEAVDEADVLLVSVRRRTLPPSQLDRVRRHVSSGKPVIGIRTASHAFSLRNKPAPQGRGVWPEFDRAVFGGNYTNHYGNALQTTISVERSFGKHPLMRGLASIESFSSGGSLYRVSPLAEGAVVLMTGRVQGESPEPVAWTYRRSDGGKSFYTSLGHVDDFQGPVLPQLLVNAVAWAVAKPAER